MKHLLGKKIVSIASNLPGPTACHRLAQWGAEVIKIEPPAGDQLNHFYPEWYHRLNDNQTILSLDLKNNHDRKKLDSILESSHLLITSSLSASLHKLNLNWEYLQHHHKKLSQLQIYSYPDENRPGHDLNFQLHSDGLVEPPSLPRSLYADLIASERIASIAIMLLHTSAPALEKVYLCDPIRELAYPVKYEATTAHGPLGGLLPGYNLYRCKDGWIALCALEMHFLVILYKELRVDNLTKEDLSQYFGKLCVSEALALGKLLGIPISSTQAFDPI